MDKTNVPEPLAKILYTYADANAFTETWPASLKIGIGALGSEGAEKFRRQLADAILHRTIPPADYEAITGADFDTAEDLEKWLREIWTLLYGDVPVTAA